MEYKYKAKTPNGKNMQGVRNADSESELISWIRDKGWIPIDDPLPYCQHDAFLPIRVKGRDIGEPQWGQLEILENGKWKEYIPDQ